MLCRRQSLQDLTAIWHFASQISRKEVMSPGTFIMHQNAVVTDVEDMFSVDFDVVNRLAVFSTGERFDTASGVISEQQVFADSQVSDGHELLSVFAPERMAGGCADDVR